MDYYKANKEAWEEVFEKHQLAWGDTIYNKLNNSAHPFLEECTVAELKAIKLEGKTIGQFCCNNGRELLSIMKFGAKKGVGFDIAENFVKEGNQLAGKLGYNCVFEATNIIGLDEKYNDYFDLIFISIGALCWFDDLNLFFEKVSKSLVGGGVTLINEQHPYLNMLAMPGEEQFESDNNKKIVYSYFRKEPWIENKGMDYVGGLQYDSKPFYSYSHTMSEVMEALIQNGIGIEKFVEYDYDISNGFKHLDKQGIPLSYLLKGKKL